MNISKEQTGMDVSFVIRIHHGKEEPMKIQTVFLGSSFSKRNIVKDVTNEELQKVADLINKRPRKRLGFKTPLEVLAKVFKSF